MNKFILAENPMRSEDDTDLFIIHLLKPIAIIQCHHGHVQVPGKISEHFQFTNIDGVLEEWTLSVYHFFTTDFISEPEEQVKPMLKKAWRWYRSYLDWEDKQLS